MVPLLDMYPLHDEVSVMSNDVTKYNSTSVDYEQLENYISPLEAFFGVTSRDGSREEAARVFDETFQRCISDEGLNNVVTPRSFSSHKAMPKDHPVHSREWVEKYGFGISTTFFSTELAGEELGYDPDFATDDSEALGGSALELRSDSDDSAQTVKVCCEKAVLAARRSAPLMVYASEHSDVYDRLAQTVSSHSRLVAFDDAVSAAVAEHGQRYVRDERWAMFGVPSVELHDTAVARADGVERAKLTESERSVLADLQCRERELATLVFDCGGGFLARQQLVNEIRTAVETDFIETHKESLEEFKAAQP